jgi:hypothetical protein
MNLIMGAIKDGAPTNNQLGVRIYTNHPAQASISPVKIINPIMPTD